MYIYGISGWLWNIAWTLESGGLAEQGGLVETAWGFIWVLFVPGRMCARSGGQQNRREMHNIILIVEQVHDWLRGIDDIWTSIGFYHRRAFLPAKIFCDASFCQRNIFAREFMYAKYVYTWIYVHEIFWLEFMSAKYFDPWFWPIWYEKQIYFGCGSFLFVLYPILDPSIQFSQKFCLRMNFQNLFRTNFGKVSLQPSCLRSFCHGVIT